MMKLNLQLFASGSTRGGGGGRGGSGRSRGTRVTAAGRRFASRTNGASGRYGRRLGNGRYGVSADNSLPF